MLAPLGYFQRGRKRFIEVCSTQVMIKNRTGENQRLNLHIDPSSPFIIIHNELEVPELSIEPNVPALSKLRITNAFLVFIF